MILMYLLYRWTITDRYKTPVLSSREVTIEFFPTVGFL